MMRTRFIAIVCGILVLAGGYAMNSYSHCQVPCGIYGDELKFDKLRQDIETIKKAMNQIAELSQESQSAQNYNQLVRWINNKEEHAEHIMTEAEDYFLAQRIKAAEESNEEAYDKYVNQLVKVHKVIVDAMKCKQTVDVANAEKLSQSLEAFYTAYFGPDHERHTHN